MNTVVLLAAVLLVGLAGLLGALLGKPGERITSMWVGAEVHADGTAQITEVIDYDFAGEDRHGIFREVPGTDGGDAVVATATMDGAPVPYEAKKQAGDTRIVIGDPDATLTGIHRYRIEYTLPRLGDEDVLAWDAVGTEWEVPVEHVDVHLSVPLALEDPSCAWGKSGADQKCAVEQPSPGRLNVSQDGLGAQEGLTLYAWNGDTVPGSAVALPQAPNGGADIPAAGATVLTGWLWATVMALAAAVVATLLIRLAGRERVETTKGQWGRMDILRLDATVEPSFEPPVGIGPAQAGILLSDRVSREHQAAWLLTAALDGHVTFNGGWKRPVLRRARDEATGDRLTDEVITTLFARRDTRIGLGGRYNKAFATTWRLLRKRLEEWRRAGGEGLWLPSGDLRRRIAFWAGLGVAVIGTAAVGFASIAVTAPDAAWRLPTAIAAALAGAGLAALVGAWELRVRTVRGSRLWRQTEGYRRYLAELGQNGWTKGDEEAITAWAVALGQSKALLSAATSSRSGRKTSGAEYDWANRSQLATNLSVSASVSATRPSSLNSDSSSGSSSSYSSGGDSGGSGGGDGGGGGGSW